MAVQLRGKLVVAALCLGVAFHVAVGDRALCQQPAAPSEVMSGGDSNVPRQVKCPQPEEVEKVLYKPLGQIRTDARPSQGPLPMDCTGDLFRRGPLDTRTWGCTQYRWVAPEVSHQPLYFDDVPLERYGQSACPLAQPLISGVRFYSTFPLMPYKLLVDLPWEPVSNLGVYRAGSDVPCTRETLH